MSKRRTSSAPDPRHDAGQLTAVFRDQVNQFAPSDLFRDFAIEGAAQICNQADAWVVRGTLFHRERARLG